MQPALSRLDQPFARIAYTLSSWFVPRLHLVRVVRRADVEAHHFDGAYVVASSALSIASRKEAPQ